MRAVLERYVDVVNAGDWEAAIEFYASDPEFFWIEDGAVRYRSAEDVAEAFAGLGDVFESFEIGFDEVRVVPLTADAVNVGLMFHQAMTTASGMRVEIEGAILATMVERDGAWRFLFGHTSSRRPQPVPEDGGSGDRADR